MKKLRPSAYPSHSKLRAPPIHKDMGVYGFFIALNNFFAIQ